MRVLATVITRQTVICTECFHKLLLRSVNSCIMAEFMSFDKTVLNIKLILVSDVQCYGGNFGAILVLSLSFQCRYRPIRYSPLQCVVLHESHCTQGSSSINLRVFVLALSLQLSVLGDQGLVPEKPRTSPYRVLDHWRIQSCADQAADPP